MLEDGEAGKGGALEMGCTGGNGVWGTLAAMSVRGVEGEGGTSNAEQQTWRDGEGALALANAR